MSKISIISSITSNNTCEEKKLLGIKLNNNIVYIDDSIKTTIDIIDNSIELKRESNDYIIKLKFSNIEELGTYYLKEYNKTIALKIITKKLLIRDNLISIEYILYNATELMGEYKFILKYKNI